MRITEGQLRRIIRQEMNEMHHPAHARHPRLGPENFHVVYPNFKTLRLLVYGPGFSTFFEAQANEHAVGNLLRDLNSEGFMADPEDLLAAIEMA